MKARFSALFDGLKIDSEDGIFLEDGKSFPITPKELSVLCLLMSEAGRLVEKDRILEEVWSNEHAGDSSLMRSISSLRKRLQQVSSAAAESIKTEHGRGYRFVGEVVSSQLVVTDDMFYALIDASPDFIALKDGQGRWQAANQAGLAMYKLSMLDWIGKTDLELGEMVPEFRDNLTTCHQSDEAAWNIGEPSYSVEYVKTAELELVFHVSKSPLFHSDGTRKTLVVHGRNVTELLKAKGEL